MGALLALSQSAPCLPEPREPSVPFFSVFFRSTSLRKEQRCFPKGWTAFCHLFQTWFRGNLALLFLLSFHWSPSCSALTFGTYKRVPLFLSNEIPSMLTWHCWAYFVEVTGRKEMFVRGKEMLSVH